MATVEIAEATLADAAPPAATVEIAEATLSTPAGPSIGELFYLRVGTVWTPYRQLVRNAAGTAWE